MCAGLIACGYEGTPGTLVSVNRLELGRDREPLRVSIWLSLLAGKLAMQARTERDFVNLTPPTRFDKFSPFIFAPQQC